YIAATVHSVKSEPGVAVDHEAFDRDPDLLNLLNGTLHLPSGELRPHRPDDLITKQAPVRYDAAARCPRWEAFLARVLPKGHMRRYLQRWTGYILTGHVTE